MLSRIFIQNFALIDRLEINLRDGLQVITGETGAGKSIILGALRLILGERADAKNHQNAEGKSVVEAEFTIGEVFQDFFNERDLDYEPHTILRREVSPAGKSRAFINDLPVTLDVLKDLSSRLIDIHSQFQTANIFDEAYQFEIVDGLCDNKALLAEYRKEFSAMKSLRRELQNLRQNLAEKLRETDYKNFLLQELQDENLDGVDFEELQSQLSIQENAGLISENLAAVLELATQEEVGGLRIFSEMRSKLSKIADMSSHFKDLGQRFETQFIDFKDLIAEIEAEAEKVEIQPEVLFELNKRVDRINALFLKHQVQNVPELVIIRDRLSGEQNAMAETEERIAETERKIAAAESSVAAYSERLAANRKGAAPVFKQKVEVLLKKLGLENARIQVELQASSDFSEFGKETVSILFQANAGFPLKPIQTAISGGERSRVMLAVKKIMAENTALPTLVLDEIDTGVSGKIADEMGRVMKEMSEDMQLIVITHLAQVAAKGDDNYKVVKSEVGGKTQTTIVPLDLEQKRTEIAQLLSGAKITEAALHQARELMQ